MARGKGMGNLAPFGLGNNRLPLADVWSNTIRGKGAASARRLTFAAI